MQTFRELNNVFLQFFIYTINNFGIYNFGIIGIQLKWFESYLNNRTQQCMINGKLSSQKTITCGVPQGSILGSLLFLLYINDMPESLN